MRCGVKKSVPKACLWADSCNDLGEWKKQHPERQHRRREKDGNWSSVVSASYSSGCDTCNLNFILDKGTSAPLHVWVKIAGLEHSFWNCPNMQVLVSSPWRCLEPHKLRIISCGEQSSRDERALDFMDVCKPRESCRKWFGDSTEKPTHPNWKSTLTIICKTTFVSKNELQHPCCLYQCNWR